MINNYGYSSIGKIIFFMMIVAGLMAYVYQNPIGTMVSVAKFILGDEKVYKIGDNYSALIGLSFCSVHLSILIPMAIFFIGSKPKTIC